MPAEYIVNLEVLFKAEGGQEVADAWAQKLGEAIFLDSHVIQVDATQPEENYGQDW